MRTQIRLLSALLACLGASVASAEPAPSRAATQLGSAVTRLKGGKVPLLSRLAGEGSDQVATRLLTTLPRIASGIGGKFTESFEHERLRREGRDWSLEVGDGGNSFRFRRTTPSARNLPLELKPSRRDVEDQGRRVLGNFQEFLPLSADEEMIFMGTKYGYSGAQRTGATTSEPTEVIGWAAVFGRTVGGELVVGGGSIVAVLFNADGTVEGIDGDWPRYQRTGAELEVLPLTEIARRAQSLRLKSTGVSEAQTGIECGYFDPGGRKSSQQTIVQPACAQRVNQTTGTGERRAEIRFIPAAKRPMKSLAWPELAGICVNELCDEPPKAARRLGTAAAGL